MRRELLVPKLGLTMTEGVLVEWMLKPGDAFKVDQGLFVIESEKAANEIGAEAEGVLLETTAEAGATLPCGAVIGYWDDGVAGESGEVAEPGEVGKPAVAAPTPSAPVSTGRAAETPSASMRIPVTPLARRLAQQKGVDLSGVVGSGPRGRIRAKDVLALAAQVTAPVQAPSALERTVAQRLTAAKQEIPHFYLSVEAEMTAVMNLRKQINAAQSRQRLTLNHFVLAAVGQALEAMPEVNCVWTDDGILSLASSDVGMAVNTDKGLMVPVLRAVGRQSLSGIAKSSLELIERAQNSRLSSAEMQGGAITVSNAGMHDVTYMASIINPGQSMILGVGSIREVFRPDDNGQPVIRREMGMVLSADHRVLDGGAAGRQRDLVG
ncbi:MAG: dihydrolipoamide acetyltransferase family protein, partial [Stenotrophomonas sp.]